MCAFFIGDKMDKYMKCALKEANKALLNDEVPIGAIIIRDNKIISRGYNKKEKTQNVTSHAEMIAIQKACKKLNNWRLNNCILYVTVEPCIMCYGAIIQSRIKKIVYGIDNESFGGTKILDETIKKNNIEIVKGIEKEKC